MSSSRRRMRRRRRLRIKAPHQTMSRDLGVVKTDHTTSSHSESWRLSNSIRIRNQVQRPRLVYHLQFMRELRALQKGKSLQDPVVITTNPLVSSSSFLSRGLRLDDGDDSRDVGGARDEKCSSKAVKKESCSNGSRNRRDSSAQKESWGDGLERRRRDSMAPVQGKNRDAIRRSSSNNRASGRKWMDTEKAKSTSVREEDEEEEECQADAAATRDSKLTKEFVCENSRNRACLLSNYRRNQGLQGNDLGESRFQTEEEQQQQQDDDDDDELSPAEREETMSTRSLRHAPSSLRHREGNTSSGHVPILLRTQRSSSKTTTRRFKAVRHTSNLRKPEAAVQIKETRIDSREEEAEERQEVRACQKSSQQNRGDEDQQHEQQQQRRPELPRKLVVHKELEPLLQGYGRRLPWNHHHHHRQQQQLVSKKSNFHEGERAWKKKPGGPDPVTDPPAGLLKEAARRTKKKVMMTLVSMQQQSSRNGSELFSTAASPQDQYNNQRNVAAAATDSTRMISSDSPEVSPPFPFLMRKEDDDDDDDDDSGHGSSSSNSSMRFALKPLEPNHDIVLSHAAAQEQLHANQSLLHSDKYGMKNKQQKAQCGESSLQQLKEPKMMMMMHTRMAQASEDEQKLLAQCRTLSQKYRPKSFNELMGHTMVVKSLTMAIRKHKIAPAYLFTGPRGTGKTTAARIFAAAISCSVVATSEVESQECGNCRRNSLQECAARACQKDDDDEEEDSCSSDDDADDVKEIDAAVASNMDLQHMLQQSMLMRQRNLSSPSSFSSSPNSCCCSHRHHRYKVLIVEGCHLLSSQIWNAFLTLLEEPPAYLVFILITTESDQLPLTVTSRCQRFSFNKLKESDIIKRLRSLALKESLNVDKDAFAAIASRADGSLRDAEMLLDQLSLLDKTISSDMVQELVGLIPENKLLDLLDVALSADTVHTVRQMRQVLDLGVDPLSLVSQLASLITNLLAGSFDMHQCEIREDGFFKRDFPRKEELRRLRQALKVLSEAEKQLRVSSDRPTWLTAALLQFAPDHSFLPSSANTSTQQISRLSSFKAGFGKEETAQESWQSRGLQTKDEQFSASQKFNISQQSTISTSLPTLAMCMETKRRKRTRRSHPLGIQADAKVHPAELPLDNVYWSKPRSSDWWLQQQKHWVGADDMPATNDVLLCMSDSSKPVYSSGFRRLHRQKLKGIWNQVLQSIHSDSMQQFLLNHGNLLAISIANDDTHAIAQLEFQQLHHKLKAERSRSQICHALQMVLNCPVELQISLLGRPPTLNTNGSTIARMQEAEYTKSQGTRRASCSRLRSEEEMVEQSNDFHTQVILLKEKGLNRSRARSKSEITGQLRNSFPRIKESGSRSFGGEYTERQTLKDPQGQGEKKVMKQQCQRQQMQKLHEKQTLHKPATTMGGVGLTSISEPLWNLRFEQINPLLENHRSILCWKIAYSDKRKRKSRGQRAKGKSLLLRLVPCTRSKLRKPIRSPNLRTCIGRSVESHRCEQPIDLEQWTWPPTTS
ncbi:unnamed protein product [Sphagnum balticum]